MTQPGELNRRLLLDAPVESDDGAGGVARSYQTVTTLWAKLEPVSARGDVAADSLGAAITHRIVIRKRAGITTRHRFQDGTHIYRIVAVHEQADRRFLEIMAQVRTD